MTGVIAIAALLWAGYLFYEAFTLRRDRNKIAHIIHVNGTRGKSTVSRMIDAGLRAGGLQTFCKTTGTDPMIIDVNGIERPVIRRGSANIKEQIRILHQAAKQNAEVLIVECMAVQPELQKAAQQDILKADIGVITNVRRDHTDVMGESLEEICDALSNTIPDKGILFTAEQDLKARMEKAANKRNTKFICTEPDGSEPVFDFPDNLALALAVCTYMGVSKESAMQGIERYHRDPYVLSVYAWKGGIFVNALSVNDISSTCLVWERVCEQYRLREKELIILVNNRADRGSRTKDMLEVCRRLTPQQVWLMGAAKKYMQNGIHKTQPSTRIQHLSSVQDFLKENITDNQVILAVGNIADGGRELMEQVRKEGKLIVQ